MFVGAIPAGVQQILWEHSSVWPGHCNQVYVACCGNFTVERVLDKQGRFTFHSNDVSLYSSILGALFAGKPFPIKLRERYHDKLSYMLGNLADPVEAAATVMLAGDIAPALDSAGEWRDNPYYNRLLKGYQAQWPRLIRKTSKQLQDVGLYLASYDSEDAATWIERVPDDAALVSYPPFYDTAGGGYTSLYWGLEHLFEWDKPAYAYMDQAGIARFMHKVTHRAHWIMGLQREIEEYAPFLRGIVQPTERNIPIYVYSSDGQSRVSMPVQVTAPILNPRLQKGAKLGDTLTVHELTLPQFRSFRAQFLNKHIVPGDPTAAYGVCVDGFLVGAFGFSTAPNPGQYSDLSGIYLMSDFAVEPTDYDKLAKLVLCAALSKEVRLIAERLSARRIRSLVTTAFTNNPVSMKYRGIFQLHSRKEVTDDPHYKYALQYTASAGQWSLSDALAYWKKNYS